MKGRFSLLERLLPLKPTHQESKPFAVDLKEHTGPMQLAF